jgi:hypothetical protein
MWRPPADMSPPHWPPPQYSGRLPRSLLRAYRYARAYAPDGRPPVRGFPNAWRWRAPTRGEGMPPLRGRNSDSHQCDPGRDATRTPARRQSLPYPRSDRRLGSKASMGGDPSGSLHRELPHRDRMGSAATVHASRWRTLHRVSSSPPWSQRSCF